MPEVNATSQAVALVEQAATVRLRPPGDPGNRKRKLFVLNEARKTTVPQHGR